MAHFAKINEDNIVVDVLVVADADEHRGQEFLADDLRLGGTWIQTSYNTVAGGHRLGGTPVRGNYAGVGLIYDPDLDAFYPPQPIPSWTLNESTFQWEAPVPQPDTTTGKRYEWIEDDGEWVELVPEVTPGGDADNPYPGDGNNPPFYQWNTETNEWDLVPE